MTAQTTSQPGRIAQLYNLSKEDQVDASLAQKATVMVAIGGLGFEWGSGNESLLGYVGGNVHEITNSPIATGLAAGAVTFAEQGAIGVLMAATICNYPKVADAIRDMTKGKESDAARSSGKLSRFGSVMFLGAAVELVKENARRPLTRAENTRRAIGSAAIIATANTALIGGVSAAMTQTSRYGFESETETAVNVLSSPFTYLGAFAGYLGYQKIKRMLKSKENDDDQRS